MAKKTPPLHTRGRYTLKQPWSTDATTLWECYAIRSFDDIYKLSVDVYQQYYAPKNLDEATFQADRQEGANIITLMNGNGDVLYVPDTYILAYPSMDNVPYSHVILSMSVGALPDYLDLTFLGEQIAAVASDVIGYVPTVKVHRAPTVNAFTPTQHEEAEAGRLAAVKLLTTDHARLQQAQATIDALQQKVANYEKIMIAKNLI